MKILSAEQIRKADAYTISNEPISSLELMERAAGVFTQWFMEKMPDRSKIVHIVCGMGNNGGDGLVVARQLYRSFYNVRVYVIKFSATFSPDAEANFERLPDTLKDDLVWISEKDTLPTFDENSMVVDAIFGSGLSRPIEGFIARVVDMLNAGGNPIYSIDLPSGLYADAKPEGAIVEAHATLSFELPKLAFFVSDSAYFAGLAEWRTIGLDKEYIEKQESPCQVTMEHEMRQILRMRSPFSHKGTFGHVMLICGSLGSMGASLLAGRASLKSGSGLLTMHVPHCGYEIVQTALPEAMVSLDINEYYVSQLPDTDRFSALGIGCGIGTKRKASHMLKEMLRLNKPTVIDADGINILAEHKDWLEQLPDQCILTPHPGEFDRLCSKCADGWDRLEKARVLATQYKTVVVLKGHYTAVVSTSGEVYFNPTGNSGMATAGSGDTLTGIITSLLGQGYAPIEAARLGVFIHGRAGDLAIVEGGEEALVASEIIDHLGKAFQSVRYGT